MRSIATLIFLLSILIGCGQPKITKTTGKKIIVEIQFSINFIKQIPANLVLKETMEMEYCKLIESAFDPQYKSVKSEITDGKVKWVLYSDDHVQVNFGFGRLNIVAPGDSIHISYNGNITNISGTGSDKLIVWEKAVRVGEDLVMPSKNVRTINSVEDYLRWNQHIDHKLQLQLELIEGNKGKLSPFEYEFLKTSIVSSNEGDRLTAYSSLYSYRGKHPEAGITFSNLSEIWDSTQYNYWNQWLHSISNYYGSIDNLYAFNRMEVWRQFGFDFTNDSLSSREIRASLYYSNAKNNYRGLLRERLLALTLNDQAIREKKVQEATRLAMLKDYYSQPDFPEYKQWVKSQEEKTGK